MGDIAWDMRFPKAIAIGVNQCPKNSKTRAIQSYKRAETMSLEESSEEKNQEDM